MPGAQFLRFGWEGQERVDLALREQGHEIAVRAGDPVDLGARVEPDMRCHQRKVEVAGLAERADADAQALEVAAGPDASCANSS